MNQHSPYYGPCKLQDKLFVGKISSLTTVGSADGEHRSEVSGRLACANVLEDGGDDVEILDAGDHSEFAAAFRAGI